jgi:hypothetical protein
MHDLIHIVLGTEPAYPAKSAVWRRDVRLPACTRFSQAALLYGNGRCSSYLPLVLRDTKPCEILSVPQLSPLIPLLLSRNCDNT